MRKKFPVFPILAILALIMASAAHAQESSEKTALNGAVYGTVVNKSTGEALVGANVILMDTRYGSATDLDGRFEIANIPTGRYTVQASVVGYRKEVRTDVIVSPSRPTEIRFVLEQSALELEVVEVRAPLFQKRNDAKVSTVTVSNEEIRRLPGGFEDVVRAVSILPGVAQAMPGRNDLVVRGGAPSENLYLLDNIEIPNINHFGTQGASGGPQSYINLDFVDRTEFSAGGYGAEYGNKLSSVLRIDLRDGRKDRMGGKATVSASQFGLNLEGPIDNDGGSFLFSARRSYLDFIFKAAGFSFVPEYWDFLGKANKNLTERDLLSVTAIGAIDKVIFFNDDADQRYGNSTIAAPTQNTGVIGLTWKHLFGKGFSTVTLAQNYVDFDVIQRDTTLTTIFRNRSVEQEWSIRGDIVWSLAQRTELSAGLQQALGRYDADQYFNFQSTFGSSSTLTQRYSTLTGKSALYTQLSQGIGRLRVSVGGRFDYFDAIDDGTALSPRASATYALTPVTNLNASVGRYRQTPAVIWLLSNPYNRGLSLMGADQAVIGIDHLLRYDVKVGIEGYYKTYFDYPASLDQPWIVMSNTGAGFGGSTDNFTSYGLDRLVSEGTGRSRGFEVFGQKKASDNPHYALVSLSYNETWFTGLDGIERAGSYDQRWIFNIGGGFIFSNNLETSFKFRLATGMPYTPYEADGSQDPAKLNSERTGINHSLDLRIDRRWYFTNRTLIAFFDVQNVYNNPYVGAPSWDERTGTTAESESIGLLPSIGISYEF